MGDFQNKTCPPLLRSSLFCHRNYITVVEIIATVIIIIMLRLRTAGARNNSSTKELFPPAVQRPCDEGAR